MPIMPYYEDRYDEVIAFISHLNDQPENHIGYLEQGTQQLIHDLAELAVPMSATFQLAIEDGRLAGVMGYDADESLGKVWLLGPFVDSADWQATAVALYAKVLETLPSGLNQLELFGNVANENLATFADAHGFKPLAAAHLLRKGRPIELPPAHEAVRSYEPNMAAEVTDLHDATFPNTYYAAAQLFDMIDEKHQLLVAMREDQALGYAFMQLAPEVGRAYIDFVGVAISARHTGVGRALLDMLIRSAFSQQAIDRLELTVNADNEIALQLYRTAGFEVAETMRGYRCPRVAVG